MEMVMVMDGDRSVSTRETSERNFLEIDCVENHKHIEIKQRMGGASIGRAPTPLEEYEIKQVA